MSKRKKIAGFIGLLSVVLITLQLTGMVSSKHMAFMGKGTSFLPSPDSAALQQEEETTKTDTTTEEPTETEAATETDTGDTKNDDVSDDPPTDEATAATGASEDPATNKPDEQPVSQQQGSKQQATNENSSDEHDKKTEISTKSDTKNKNIAKSAVPKTVTLSEAKFIALDNIQSDIINSVKNAGEQDAYGWGLLGKYKNPDDGVKILGGVPFAINSSDKRYYRIVTEEKQVRPVILLSAYSTIGIETQDTVLPRIVKNAIRDGSIVERHARLSYHYLFRTDTEKYLTGKVNKAFEWYINKSGLSSEKADEFRGNARVRLEVYKILRKGGGEMGVAIPAYFTMNDQSIKLADSYYKDDPEAVKLGIKHYRN